MALPALRSGTITYWFWDHIPEEALIQSQLAEMKRSGIECVQIQARLSLPIDDYLTPAYLEAVRVALSFADEIGLEVGFYDEYGWQSGSAGGLATKNRPDLCEAFLFWSEITGDARDVAIDVGPIHSSAKALGDAGTRWHYRDATLTWGDIRLLGFLVDGEFVAPGASSLTVHDGHETIRATLSLDPDITFRTDVLAIFTATAISSRSINYLSHEATAQFLAQGYDPLWKAAEALGSHTVTHVFYDQPHPHAYSWSDADGESVFAFPYSNDLWEALGHSGAPSHAEALRAITDREHDDAKRIDWWRFFTKFAITTFFEPIKHWCAERDLLLTGHEMLGHVGGWSINHAFEDFNLLSNFGMDYFQVGQWRDVTAIDMQDTNAQLSPVLGRSIAHSKGDRSLWAELYLASGTAGTGEYLGAWNLRASEFRNTLIRGALQGITRFILHGFYLTDGHPDPEAAPFVNLRYDFPPGFNFLPWFEPLGRSILDETHSIQDLLLTSERLCRVELVYPLTEIWRSGRAAPAAQGFGEVAHALDAQGIDFWVVPDENLDSDGGSSSSEQRLRIVPMPDGNLSCTKPGQPEPNEPVSVDEAVSLAASAAEADWIVTSEKGSLPSDGGLPRYAALTDSNHRVNICHNATERPVRISLPCGSAGTAHVSDGSGSTQTHDHALTTEVFEVAVPPGHLAVFEFTGSGPLMVETQTAEASSPTAQRPPHELELTEFTPVNDEQENPAIEPPVRIFGGSISTARASTLSLQLPASKNSFVVTLNGERLGLQHGGGTVAEFDLPEPLVDAELTITSYGGSERRYYGGTRHEKHFTNDWEPSVPVAHVYTAV